MMDSVIKICEHVSQFTCFSREFTGRLFSSFFEPEFLEMEREFFLTNTEREYWHVRAILRRGKFLEFRRRALLPAQLPGHQYFHADGRKFPYLRKRK